MVLKNMALVTSIAAFTALPSIGGSFGQTYNFNGTKPAGIYASSNEESDAEDDEIQFIFLTDDDEINDDTTENTNIENEDEIDDDYNSYFIDNVFPEDDLKAYMDFAPYIYDPYIILDEDMEQHLEDESSDAFEDISLQTLANFYEDYFYLQNCWYEAKVYGTGLGFDEYIFTQGFSFVNDPEDPEYQIYFVKATPEEFQAHVDELSNYYGIFDHSEDPETGEITYCLTDEATNDCRNLTYYPDEEILQEVIYED